MNLRSAVADVFVPEGGGVERTTHLGIGAHQDDLEFMAFSGIVECFRSESEGFGGVICTDGRGSSAAGPYAGIDPVELGRIRVREQRQAAEVGRFSFVAQLGYPSRAINPPMGSGLVEDLATVVRAAAPRVIYTHNPADKHATHINVLVAVLEALREVPVECRPERLLGCEMWRSLDWLAERGESGAGLRGSGAPGGGAQWGVRFADRGWKAL